MRISAPTIPNFVSAASSSRQATSIQEAVERLTKFLRGGNVVVLTGAGVSVDSGIRAYRGEDGRYMNPNYKPLLYTDIVHEGKEGQAFRRRYWLRSYFGYPPVRDASPNTTHVALAALQYSGTISKLITQNVDGLHHKAIESLWPLTRRNNNILELHGTLRSVRCKNGHVFDRNAFQDLLSATNPEWKKVADGYKISGDKPRTNPDGDVALDGVDFDTFTVPNCPSCLMDNQVNSVLKPEVIFFGESIPQVIKDRSFSDVQNADKLLVIGTTLSTYSAFRLVKLALEQLKPVLVLNTGPTRADDLPGIQRVEASSGIVLRDVVKAVLGTKASNPAIEKLLASGSDSQISD